MHIIYELITNNTSALACVAQWTGRWPVNQKVTGLIPTWSGHVPGLWARSPVWGCAMFLSLSFSLLSPLSENK